MIGERGSINIRAAEMSTSGGREANGSLDAGRRGCRSSTTPADTKRTGLIELPRPANTRRDSWTSTKRTRLRNQRTQCR